MSLNDLISEIANEVWVNDDYFGELIAVMPRRDKRIPKLIPAVVNRDHEIGSNEVPGDGKTPDTDMGTRIRNSMVIEVPACADIDHRRSPEDVVWTFTDACEAKEFIEGNRAVGERWVLKRRLSSDRGMKTYLCVRPDVKTRKKSKELG